MHPYMILFALTGLLFVGISIPFILRRIGPNPYSGFRMPKTLANPDIWYEANAYSGRCLLVSGIVLTLAALLLTFWPGITQAGYALGWTAVMVLCLMTTLGLSLRYLRTL